MPKSVKKVTVKVWFDENVHDAIKVYQTKYGATLNGTVNAAVKQFMRDMEISIKGDKYQ